MSDEKRRNKMPKNKEEYIKHIKLSFIAGCNFGYGVVHNLDISDQENLGAQWWAGEISENELWERIGEIHGERQAAD